MPSRFAAAAVIGVLAVGGALILMRPSQSTIGGPSPTPEVSSRSNQPAGPSANPGATAVAPSLVQPRAATWTAISNMTQDVRVARSATLLPDGKVLVVGDDEVRGSAVVYDPASRTWSATKRMVQPQFGSTATLLLDGRVLVAGGKVPSSELYDPASGTWTPTGTMTARRAGHTATLLPDGRVLVTGGEDDGGFVASAELYDPSTGSWAPTGSMGDARSGHSATLLPDGKVVVSGGYRSDGNGVLASAELYDPASGTWAATRSMDASRANQTATLLLDGKALVSGGLSVISGMFGPLASAELYDPGSGR